MAKKTVADAAKAKAAKQKKMAIGLSVFLVLAMGYAIHTMMSIGGGASASKPVVATTPSGSSSAPTAAPAPTASGALPAAPSLSGAVTPTASPASPTDATAQNSSSLVAAVKPPAGTGQLQSFSLFESKDPFNASGPAATPSSSSASSGGGKSSGGGSTSGGGGGGAPAPPPKTPPAPPTAPPTSAVIAVNGVSESVSSGAAFPASNPMFQLVSLSNSSAKVSVVGGSYASGSQTLTVSVGKPVTLVNTADGTRYTIELMPQGTVATASSSGSASGSGTTTTTTTPAG
jgi:hypothetical protein